MVEWKGLINLDEVESWRAARTAKKAAMNKSAEQNRTEPGRRGWVQRQYCGKSAGEADRQAANETGD
jgi:hypothetical protein